MGLFKTKNFWSRAAAILSLAVLAASWLAAPVSAIDQDQLNVFENDIGYFNYKDDQVQNCGNGSGNLPAGTLPAIIPEPYNGAFTNGANKHKVAPALIAAIFTEENFTGTDPSQLAQRWANFPKVHPDPNSGWPTNQFNTMGAFQFIPATWASFGDDGDGNGTKDAQNIADAAAGAANYLASNGATSDKPPDQWQKAIFAYNHAQWYVDAVLQYYNFYNSGGTPAATGAVSAAPSACAGSNGINCTDGGATVTGKAAILCEARKFDPFGYLWGGGHEDPEAFMARFNSAGGFSQPFKQYVDCSGLITVALWNAYHAKIIFNTELMASSPQWFKEIPISQTQPGDFVYHPGHVEIVSAAGATATFGAHTDTAPPADQISDAHDPVNSWTKAYEYVGPGGTTQ